MHINIILQAFHNSPEKKSNRKLTQGKENAKREEIEAGEKKNPQL